MAEKTAKNKALTCALCDKAITTGKPVIIDDDPYHPDCAKAMSQSADAEVEDEEEDVEAEEVEDEDDEDAEEEEEVPAPRTKKATPVRASSKRAPVVEDDEDEDDEEDEDEEEDEEPVRPARKPAVVAKSRRAPEPDEDEDEDEDEEDEEEEEEVVVTPARKTKAAPVKATAKVSRKAAVEEDEEYEEEDEPEERPRTKAKAAAKNGAVKRVKSDVDNSGWGNPATEGSKRWFVYNAMKAVTKNDLVRADGPGKPENIIAAAKAEQKSWAKAAKKTLSEKDRNFTSMNIGWIYNHADELGLEARTNAEAGTYRIFRAKAKEDDSD